MSSLFGSMIELSAMDEALEPFLATIVCFLSSFIYCLNWFNLVFSLSLKALDENVSFLLKVGPCFIALLRRSWFGSNSLMGDFGLEDPSCF